MGWYHATPKDDKQSRLQKLREQYKEELELSLPECEAAYLVPLFLESGICSSNINGIVELPWQEIAAWLSCSQRELSVWEVDMIRDMSGAYVSEYNLSSDRTRLMPYREQKEIKINREAVSKGFAAMFAQFKEKE